MLDQIGLPRPFGAGRGDQFSGGVKLMVARENHGFAGPDPDAAFTVVHLFLFFVEEQKMAQDVEETFALQYFLPEISAAVAGGMLRVACAALHFARMAAAIEGEEEGFVRGKLRGHVHGIRVSGEMD